MASEALQPATPLVGCVACGGTIWLGRADGEPAYCPCGRSRASLNGDELTLIGPSVVAWLSPGDPDRISIRRGPVQPLI
jgi:hypothetical protein